MNTTLAIILTIVVTNWTEIGEFKDKSGKTFSVQEGRVQTNIVVDVPWNDLATNVMILRNKITGLDLDRPVIVERYRTSSFILKSFTGPIIGEKRVEITNIWVTNMYLFTNWSEPYKGRIILNGADFK